MSVDTQILTLVVDNPKLITRVRQLGITADDFEDPYSRIFNYLVRTRRELGSIPSRDVVKSRFPEMRWSNVAERDLPVLVKSLRERRRYGDFVNILLEAAQQCQSPDDVPGVLEEVQAGLNRLSMSNGENPIVNVVSEDFRKRLIREIRERKRAESVGVSTGFPTLDRITGGLQAGRMVVAIGRSGSGKSWLDLFFVAEAILQGKKVLLYPLEMSVYETMMRLYTIFSQKMFGGRRTFKNLDLTHGYINKGKFLRFLSLLEDKYNGNLLVSDISKLNGPYTIDRIEAEVEVHQPNMFWVDYLTLMRVPSSRGGSEDWQAVRTLSSGIKGIALRSNTIGGCSAQVNREFMKTRAKLPRLEHISFGDSIGQDADHVISLAKDGGKLLYALTKNRHGPEIAKVECLFDVNDGRLEEIVVQEVDDDDEG